MLGRDKDIYKVSGEIVSPGEVEEVISRHFAGNQVSILGGPDCLKQEEGDDLMELETGKTFIGKEIIEWCSTRLARFKRPRHVWLITANDWPMTSTGKIQKFRLRDMAIEKLSSK